MNDFKDLDLILDQSRQALKEMNALTQEEVDAACKAVAETIRDHAEILAKEAVVETRMGVAEHKVGKNLGVTRSLWHQLKNKKSVGIIEENPVKKTLTVAHPKGIIGCVTPTTNPTLSVVGNTMAAIKGRNTVIISPHPRAEQVTGHTVKLIQTAFKELGLPDNVLQIVSEPTNEKSQALMSRVDVVVATGGMGIVGAAYSSGKPAYGVGQGNVQVVISDSYNNFDKLADDVVTSRHLDAGVQCIGDQVIIVPETNYDPIIEAFQKHGAYYIEDEATINTVRTTLFDEEGRFSGELVGKTAQELAEIMKFEIPENTRILLVAVEKFGADELLCGEKMCPVTAAIKYNQFSEGLHIAKTNLVYQGAGHTSVVYSNVESEVKEAGLTLPVGRLIVNNAGQTATGGTLQTSIQSTSSIGCGSWGNNSISENLTYKHLLNLTTVAYELDETPPTDIEIYG